MKQNRSSIRGQTTDMEDFTISPVLRTYRPKKGGVYPVQLYIYHKPTGRKKNYGTNITLSKEEFIACYDRDKALLRRQNKVVRDQIEEMIKKTCEDLEGTQNDFSFKVLDSKLLRSKKDRKNIYWYLRERIDFFVSLGSESTASLYDSTLKCLMRYNTSIGGPLILNFDAITPTWLKKFEIFMIGKGSSKNTIAMYLRSLRAVFNKAISDSEIEKSSYPFGVNKYVIKEGGKVKKALSLDDIKKLFNSTPLTQYQRKAKDFWFFSYLSNGLNIKDIIFLKYSQVQDGKFWFERIKTAGTYKRVKIIEVPMSEYHLKIFREYGTVQLEKDQYIFPILLKNDTPKEVYRKNKNFTRFINQHIKKLALNNQITPSISTYFARHSLATNLIRQGKSMAFAQEVLGHSSSTTTERYFAGFSDETKLETAENLYTELLI